MEMSETDEKILLENIVDVARLDEEVIHLLRSVRETAQVKKGLRKTLYKAQYAATWSHMLIYTFD